MRIGTVRMCPVLHGACFSLWLVVIAASCLLFAAQAYSQATQDPWITPDIHPRLDAFLVKLQKEYLKDNAAGMQMARDRGLAVKDGKVTVFIYGEYGKPVESIDLAKLRTYGVEITKNAGSVLQVRIPIGKMVEVADNVEGITKITLPPRPVSYGYVSEGVGLTGAAAFQAAGYTGAGVKVAVIDLGFQGLATVVYQRELPFDVIDCTGATCSQAASPWSEFEGQGHGTAVAEIIHDMAPGARIYLIKVGSQADLITAKDFCITEGIRIVNHSAGWPNTNFYDGVCWPGYGNPVCTVNAAQANGILWVNSAGNDAQQRYTALFTDTDNDTFHDQTVQFHADAGDPLQISFTWDAWPVTDTDYNIGIYDSSGNVVYSSTPWVGGQQMPVKDHNDYLSVTAQISTSGTYSIRVKRTLGTINHKFVIFSWYHDLTPATVQGSISTPADTASALTVGAIDYRKWATGPVEDYSSQGPTNGGLVKPDITGPDFVSTLTYGPSGFSGTSASSPHVAGAAVLLLSKNPALTVTQLRNALTGSAIPMGTGQPNNVYGYGRLSLPPVLTVAKTGTGTGRVTSVPAGIDCGTTCSALFDHTTPITLTAVPDEGKTFTGWSGAGCSGTDPCVVTLSGDGATVTATFGLPRARITSTDATIQTETVSTTMPAGAPANFTGATSIAFTANGIAGATAGFSITFDALPAAPVFYKVVGGVWKQIYPTNECAGITGITIVGTTLNFTLADNSDCDSDPTDHAVADPLVVGAVAAAGGGSTAAAGGGGGGGGGMCFIATAAYGSYLDPHVSVLRRFRDRFLLTSGPGRAFVNLYYTWSPPAARFIERHTGVKTTVRAVLTVLVSGIEHPYAAAGVLLLFGAAVPVIVRKRRRFKGLRSFSLDNSAD